MRADAVFFQRYNEDYLQQGIAEYGLYLTNRLLTGPNLNPDLLGVSIRFRQHKNHSHGRYKKKSFLQICLAEKDRDAVRFLWLTVPPKEDTGEKLCVLTRVVFGVSPSSFFFCSYRADI